MAKQYPPASGDRRNSNPGKPRTSKGDHAGGHLAGRADRTSSAGHSGKTSSHSEGHRGWRPDEAGAPAKGRWSTSDRQSRDERRPATGAGRDDRTGRVERPSRDGRPASGGRPDWSPRGERPSTGGRPDWQPRGERPARGDRPDRPDWKPRNEWQPRDDRGARPDRGAGNDRGGYAPRNDRGASSDRGGYAPRNDRNDRGASNNRDGYQGRSTSSDRGGYAPRNDRGSSNDRGGYQGRDDRSARPARGERPDWQPRGERSATGGRPEWTPRSDRPARDDRSAGGYRGTGGDRSTGGYRGNRDERPARSSDWKPRNDGPPAEDSVPYTRAPREDRPSWRDREARDDRGQRDNRPPREDRGPRNFREERAPRENRDDRGNRPARDDRAPYADRAPREERGPRDSTESHTPFVPPVDVVHERLEATTAAADAGAGTSFGDLGLGDNLVRQLAALGASEPFPIQAATIPQVIAGRDVLGRGRTGSGKTIAFGAPLVERLLQLHRDRNSEGGKGRTLGRRPRAIILAPTRELAQQIDRTVQPLARSVGLFTISIVGGVPYQRQLTGLQRGVDIVIGTPGRIQDLVDKRELDLSQIAISVLDEADHMCDLGFLEPVQELLRQTPEGSQRLLFSATLDRAVESLVAEFLDNPSIHEVEGEDQASSTISHRVLVIDNHTKREVLKELVGDTGRAIVFSRTRVFADEIANLLDDAGIAAVSMHGDLNQAKRNRSLAALSGGRVRALVATDVAARGIHVDDVELVVQADMPDDHKTYMHRSGRTGRAGAHGTVITVIPAARRRRMEELLELAGIEAEWEDRSTPRPPRADGGARGPWRERGDRPARPRY